MPTQTISTQRDPRLPEGFNTWLSLLRYCQTIPELAEMINNQNRDQETIKSIVYLDDRRGREKFSCDIMTLKLRVLEELLPLLPTKEEAYQEEDSIRRMLWQLDPLSARILTSSKFFNLIQKLQ